jgi:hypothetical protein
MGAEFTGRRWTLRICKECGGTHQRFHDGCVTRRWSFPQVTEWAGVDEVDVIELAAHEAIVADLRAALDAANRTIKRAASRTVGRACACHAYCGDVSEDEDIDGAVCKWGRAALPAENHD